MSEAAKSPERTSYSTDGAGRWWQRVWAEQCPAKVFPRGRCQGVAGHRGVHWRFNEGGWFYWQDNAGDPGTKQEAGWTPPDHKNYRSPLEMQPLHYLKHSTESEVADAGLIARLERGELRAGESLSRPAREGEWPGEEGGACP